MCSFVDHPSRVWNAEVRFDRDRVSGRPDISFSLKDETEKTATAANQFGYLLLTPDAGYARMEPLAGLEGGHSSMSSTDGLPGSTENATGVDRGVSEDSQPMHEGERLKRLLEAKRYEKKTFGDAAGVTKQAVGKWIKDERFSDVTWPKIVRGLHALHLSPSDIRPEEREALPKEDLTKLVEAWPKDQLIVLRRIISSDDASKDRLLAYIDGALRPVP